MILIIGGTAAYHLDLETEFGPHERLEIPTPYGAAFPILHSRAEPKLAFASRHGQKRLEVSPPFVNARANLWAAKSLGVNVILSWNGVGAVNPLLEVADFLVLDGLFDFTKTRILSFVEQKTKRNSHLQHPFDREVSEVLFIKARETTSRAFICGLYACSEGPRLETAAEIQAFKRLGADVVGMTLVPEVFLAQEVGISYASLAYVTNYATGLAPEDHSPRHFGREVAQRCLEIVRATALVL